MLGRLRHAVKPPEAIVVYRPKKFVMFGATDRVSDRNLPFLVRPEIAIWIAKARDDHKSLRREIRRAVLLTYYGNVVAVRLLRSWHVVGLTSTTPRGGS